MGIFFKEVLSHRTKPGDLWPSHKVHKAPRWGRIIVGVILLSSMVIAVAAYSGRL